MVQRLPSFKLDPKVAENTGYGSRKYDIQQPFYTSPFDTSGYRIADLKRQNMLLTQIFNAQESYVHDLRLELASLRSEVATLKSSIKKDKQLMELKLNSANNVDLLRMLFALNQPLKVDSDPLSSLRGLIKNFSDEKMDSVELIRQIRGV